MGTNISGESYPMRKKWDGCDEKYSSVDEFKQQLTPDALSSEVNACGWLVWSPETEYSCGHDSNFRGRNITEKITHVLRKSIGRYRWFVGNFLVQFWAPQEVEGRWCLTTLQQPFLVGPSLAKGLSWLRKKCMQQCYCIADEADEQGPPARVFRNGSPESSPDVLYYSPKEFPLRDFVVGCGLKSYLALPIFDVHHNQCVGLLEFIHKSGTASEMLQYRCQDVDDALQEVGLRLAHRIKTTRERELLIPYRQCQEIKEMFDLAIENTPQLHLAQVWVTCKQCGTNNSCMELARVQTKVKIFNFEDSRTSEFLAACGFHGTQGGQGIVGFALSSANKLCFCENLVGQFSISEYPMKHYVQQARFKSCLAICLRNKHMSRNDAYVFEFFLQPQSRDGASIQSIFYWLLKIMETKLKSFEIATERYIRVQYQRLEEAIQKKIYSGTYSVAEFKEFFHEVDLSCLQKQERRVNSWICWSIKGDDFSENRGNDSSIPQVNLRTEEIKLLITEISSIRTLKHPFLIQFWAPKVIGNKSFLSTSGQPFSLRSLGKGLCWYRKHCIQYTYYIGDGANDEQLGPPGRVFLGGYPESSPDPRLYSKREFQLRDHVVNSCAKTYMALPLFDLFDEQCVGVLEFVGFPFHWEQIYGKLKKHNLRATRISRPPTLPIDEGEKQELSEIKEMLALVSKSPQVPNTSVWNSCRKCSRDDIEISCMELARFSSATLTDLPRDWRIDQFIKASEFHQVQTKNGVIGKVIESESKLYFCENLCSLSICDLSLAHYAQVARLEICFAICLKSSHRQDGLYVIEFFLSPHSTKYEYSSTLCFLLSTMKHTLKSFKVASGHQLAEELIFQVRELCHEMQHHLSKNLVHFESHGIVSRSYVEDTNQNITALGAANQLTVEDFAGQCNLPLGFDNVQYVHEIEHQYSGNQICFSGGDGASNNIDQEQERSIADSTNVEDEAENITDVNFDEENERNKSSTSFHVSYEQLKSQFGKSRKDAVKNLSVSLSTFKRRCRDYGIKRWPSNMNYIKNPSLFLTDVAKKCVENVDQCQTSKPSGSHLTTPLVQKTIEFANTSQVADVVIKAKFKDENFKFEFCVSRGMEKLMEDVGKRLNLKTGEFKLKYVDEDDGDLISLQCDEDLHFYVKSMKSTGKTTVQVLVHLTS